MTESLFFEGEEDIFDLPCEDNEPEVIFGSVELRDYQKKAVDGVLKQFREKNNSTVCVMATGTGKSVVIAELAKTANDLGHGVLILVHRDELIRQLSRSCGKVGIHALIEKAGERALPGFGVVSNTVCASVQSLRGDRLKQWPQNAFRLIIIDECHHAPAKSYRDIIEHFSPNESAPRVAGFTATADRLDKKNIGQVFETLAFEYNLREAIKESYLVPVEAVVMETEPKIDLRNLRVVAGDFNQGDLEQEIQANIGTLVNAVADGKVLEDRRTLAFTPDVKSAEALALALNDVGISARWVAGDSPDRKKIFEGHQTGEYQVLVNCMIATEGYDDPEISCVLICRPTKSRSLYSQMVGRGTRRFPQEFPPSDPRAKKKNCRIVDFAYLTGNHKLVKAVDLYDNSQTPDEVVERAAELIENGDERNLDDALEKAQEEFDVQRREKIRRRMVALKARKFDPLDACEMYGIVTGKEAYDWEDAKPATTRQIEALRKWQINAPDDLGFAMANKLLNKVIGRHKNGWTAPATIANLVHSGIPIDQAISMREGEARAYLEANPLRPTPKQSNVLLRGGYTNEQIATMTRKQASSIISEIMGN